MILVCNSPDSVDQLMAELSYAVPPVGLARLARMRGRGNAENLVKLRESPRYVQSLQAIAGIGVRDGELPLG